MTRINNELRGKLEKAMEQLIAAQTAKEHAREKVRKLGSGLPRLGRARGMTVGLGSVTLLLRPTPTLSMLRRLLQQCLQGGSMRPMESPLPAVCPRPSQLHHPAHLCVPAPSCLQAHEESAKAVQYYNECQQLMGERQTLLAAAEKHRSDWTALKTRYAHKSSTLKEVGGRGEGSAQATQAWHALQQRT